MKKVILCAVALVFGTFAYAQVGGAPVADQSLVPDNSASAESNAGLSIQNGDDNRVRVRQAGELNTVYTEQDNGTGLGGNLARVMQTGDVNGNQADSGEDNAAEVRQSGSANQSTTVQEGDFNNAYTAQGQNDAASSGNKALIRQGTGNQAESNYAAIEQDGSGNQAQTQQTYDNSDAWTRQMGTDNKSMISQNAAPEASFGHEAENFQNGDRNESSINQMGAGARNTARTFQTGDDNQAKQDQTTNSALAGMGNRAGIGQGQDGFGAFQFSTITPVAVALHGRIDSEVDGSADPLSTTSAASIGAKAKQVQAGKLQEADIMQFGGTVGASNYAEQVQASGWNNDAGIVQGHFNIGETSNYAKQYQAGDNNTAGLVQEGSGFKALQDQRGHRNEALSYQTGEDNLLNIHQRGNDNDATSTQHGLANQALIVQRGGQSFVAQQNMGLGSSDLSDGGNQIDALQLGPNGDFGTDGIDCDFEDPMDLDMDYTVPGFDLGDVCPDC
tara:strand:- start:36332 stop:37837 length:1506 start_codon:yes stop_codon:yes gene_type:complete